MTGTLTTQAPKQTFALQFDQATGGRLRDEVSDRVQAHVINSNPEIDALWDYCSRKSLSWEESNELEMLVGNALLAATDTAFLLGFRVARDPEWLLFQLEDEPNPNEKVAK